MHEVLSVLSIGMGWFIIAISDLSKQRKRSTLFDHVTYVLNLGALCVVLWKLPVTLSIAGAGGELN
jgi:hypothetical protein